MGSREILRRLSHVDLLRALPGEDVQAIAPFVRLCRFKAGQRIFSEGDTGDALYLLERGQARVLRGGQGKAGTVGPGEAFGEMALLMREPSSATIVAETDLVTWRIALDDFQRVVDASPRLEVALRELAERHRAGVEIKDAVRYTPEAWQSRAFRGLEARSGGLRPWQMVMGFGFVLWATLFLNEETDWLQRPFWEGVVIVLQLLAGLTILQGACEAFIQGVERVAARFDWEGFVSGTIGSLVATLPEFVVIAFLVRVEPLAAFVAAAVTIFNNALAFSLYSFLLPKDKKGTFIMPPSLTKAGGEVLIAGSGIALIVGAVMLAIRVEGHKAVLAGFDLMLVGLVLVVIYGYYIYTLMHYYAHDSEENHPAHPPDPAEMGHTQSWRGIGVMFALGIVGAYFGGESIGAFADSALHQLGLPIIPTASALAFFAGISEYIIVWKAHRRGELGIALSNVFGGITQVMFLLVPFSIMVIAIYGFATGDPQYSIPITMGTIMLVFLLFPLFYVLLQYLAEDHTLSNLDAAAMTGIYVLLLYFLFTAPPV